MSISAEALLRQKFEQFCTEYCARGASRSEWYWNVFQHGAKAARELDAARLQAQQAGTRGAGDLTDAEVERMTIEQICSLRFTLNDELLPEDVRAALESFAANRPAGDEQQARDAARWRYVRTADADDDQPYVARSRADSWGNQRTEWLMHNDADSAVDAALSAETIDAARPQAQQAGIGDVVHVVKNTRVLPEDVRAALESFAATQPPALSTDTGDEQQARFADRPDKTLDKARNLVFALSSVLGQRIKDSDEVTLSGKQANDITTVCRAYLAEYDALERYGIPPQQEPKS